MRWDCSNVQLTVVTSNAIALLLVKSQILKNSRFKEQYLSHDVLFFKIVCTIMLEKKTLIKSRSIMTIF
jgi:hypothetical protein